MYEKVESTSNEKLVESRVFSQEQSPKRMDRGEEARAVQGIGVVGRVT
jgi:hypothetical protein